MQCKKRTSEPVDFRAHIQKLGIDMINDYSEFLNTTNDDRREFLRETLKETISNHRALIALKNLKPYYKFKCEHCDEGFEYERQRNSHELDCVYTKFDKPSNSSMDSSASKQYIQVQPKKKDTPVIVSKTTTTPTSTPTTDIAKELALMQREILQLQEGHTKLRELCTIVTEVRDQLEDLKKLKFQLELFKSAALKGT